MKLVIIRRLQPSTIMRRLNCRRVIYSARNILQPTKLETLTAWQIHPKRRAYIWGMPRGVSETADSGIISSYLEWARQRSLIRDIFRFVWLRAAYQLRDNYSNGIRAYLTLIGCPRIAKIFKQPPELILCARITESEPLISRWWDEITGRLYWAINILLAQKQSCSKEFIARNKFTD